jgi:hypothetical protein
LECGEEGGQGSAQENPEEPQDEAEIVIGGAEFRVGAVAVAAIEVVAAQRAVAFQDGAIGGLRDHKINGSAPLIG